MVGWTTFCKAGQNPVHWAKAKDLFPCLGTKLHLPHDRQEGPCSHCPAVICPAGQAHAKHLRPAALQTRTFPGRSSTKSMGINVFGNESPVMNRTGDRAKSTITGHLAETRRFELLDRLRSQHLSRVPLSATQARLHAGSRSKALAPEFWEQNNRLP